MQKGARNGHRKGAGKKAPAPSKPSAGRKLNEAAEERPSREETKRAKRARRREEKPERQSVSPKGKLTAPKSTAGVQCTQYG